MFRGRKMSGLSLAAQIKIAEDAKIAIDEVSTELADTIKTIYKCNG